MKNKLIINSLRAIRKNITRFLSLLVMSFLGVFVFTGLHATSPDMIDTIDTFLDEGNVYDIKIESFKGLSQTDLDEISKLEEIEIIEASYSLDVLVSDQVINLSSVPEKLNTLTIIEGHLPTNNSEIVIEENYLKHFNLSINDTISVDSKMLKNKEFKIVGTITSPLYFNNVSLEQYRADSALNTGKVNYYSFINEDCFNLFSYSSIYISVKDAKQLIHNSKDYLSLINNVKDKIEEIDDSYIVYDLLNHYKYSQYIDNTNSIKNLAKIFPYIFYIVAILVGLLSMNRMVNDDRNEIGTLKAFGFSNAHILFKYILFSFLATLIGATLGSILGLYLIPKLIYTIYKVLFDLPPLIINFNIDYTILGFIIALICICGSTIFTVYRVLKENTSSLLRPKPPRKGKKIFIERFKFWNKLSFSNKVTLRNLVRYKNRGVVTMIGVAGCCALLLTGFGVKASITKVPELQFNEVFHFDATAQVNQMMVKDDTTFDNENIVDYVNTLTIPCIINGSNVSIIVSENNEQLSKFVTLRDYNTNEKLSVESNKIVITEKFAELNDLNVNDILTFSDLMNNMYTYEISGICKNYINHYIFIDKATYENNGYTYAYNTSYLFLKDLDENQQDQFKKDMLGKFNVHSITFLQETIDNTNSMFESLNKVMVILICLAATLSLVVLYNLSNINIHERKKELSTLKVLGFYDEDVDGYITKENLIITFTAIVLGLIIGYFLTHLAILTVELEKTYLYRHITIESYLYAIIISVLFTLVVNLVAHFVIKKINMIETLKTTE